MGHRLLARKGVRLAILEFLHKSQVAGFSGLFGLSGLSCLSGFFGFSGLFGLGWGTLVQRQLSDLNSIFH